jgi:hypothetical protein
MAVFIAWRLGVARWPTGLSTVELGHGMCNEAVKSRVWNSGIARLAHEVYASTVMLTDCRLPAEW